MIPSATESAHAIASARAALERYGRFLFGNAKLEGELYDLGLLTNGERYMAIDLALQEICASDRRGPSPPNDIVSHAPYRNHRLYAFRWASPHLGKLMYFKFSLAQGSRGEGLVVFSFHKSE